MFLSKYFLQPFWSGEGRWMNCPKKTLARSTAATTSARPAGVMWEIHWMLEKRLRKKIQEIEDWVTLHLQHVFSFKWVHFFEKTWKTWQHKTIHTQIRYIIHYVILIPLGDDFDAVANHILSKCLSPPPALAGHQFGLAAPAATLIEFESRNQNYREPPTGVIKWNPFCLTSKLMQIDMVINFWGISPLKISALFGVGVI